MNTAQIVATATLFILVIGAMSGAIAWAEGWRVAVTVMGISMIATTLIAIAAFWITWGLA